jgi:hypothetical protein
MKENSSSSVRHWLMYPSNSSYLDLLNVLSAHVHWDRFSLSDHFPQEVD